MYDGVCQGRAQAAGRASGAIKVGLWADLVTLECSGPDMAASSGDTLLDTWIFAGDDRMVSGVWSAGRELVRGGRHFARDAIVARYAPVIARLRGDL